MLKKRKILYLIVFLLILSSVSVYAQETRIALTEKEVEVVEMALGKAGGSDESEKTLEIVGGKEVYTLLEIDSEALVVNSKGFEEGDKDILTKKLSIFVKYIQNSEISSDRQNAIMTELQDSSKDAAALMLPLVFEETKGDIFGGMKIIQPFMKPINTALGVGAIGLVLFVIITSIIDMAYILLPFVRNFGKDEQKKPWGVSYEAISAVKDVEQSLGEGNYKNGLFIYLKRRSIAYIALGVSIMYLITGGLSGIIAFILSLTRGIV